MSSYRVIHTKILRNAKSQMNLAIEKLTSSHPDGTDISLLIQRFKQKLESSKIKIYFPSSVLAEMIDSEKYLPTPRPSISRKAAESKLGIKTTTIYGLLDVNPTILSGSGYGDCSMIIHKSAIEGNFTITGTDSFIATGLSTIEHPGTAILNMNPNKFDAILSDNPFVGYIEVQIYMSSIPLNNRFIESMSIPKKMYDILVGVFPDICDDLNISGF